MANKDEKQSNIKKRILGIILILIAFYYLSALLFFPNWFFFSSVIIDLINRTVGIGKYLLFFLILIEGLILLLNIQIINYFYKIFGTTSLFLIILVFIHLGLIHIEYSYLLAKNGAGGGLFGFYIANYLNNYFGLTGAYLFLIAIGLISLLFITDVSFIYAIHYLFNKTVRLFSGIFNKLRVERMDAENTQKQDNTKTIITYYNEKDEPKRRSKPIFKKSIAENKKDIKTDSTVQAKIDFSNNIKIDNIIKDSKYIIPPTDLLNNVKEENRTKGQEKIKSSILLLQKTLDNFGIQGEVIGATQGPTVTRYEIQPAPGVKVSKITNLSNDIALAFAAAAVRIEAPIPGKNAIGIEVPNKEKDTVLLREIIESNDYKNNSYILPIALGKDIGGGNVIADLVDLPHLLIAGSTGSGKSVCLNSIILSLIYRFGPDMIKFVMVDPKRVELNVYNGIPHLILPIITNTKKVDKVLNWAISEMENRFKVFAEAGVRNLKGYHEYMKSIKSDEKQLPYIVIIIDELADLMMSSPVKIEESLCRLAQMTRATGIHLIIATQRPSVDIITGSIKINFPSRIAFAVSTQVDSRTILDVNGAEKLLGNGDMLFSPINASKPIRAQGSFVSEKEIKNIVSFLKNNTSGPEYQDNILESKISNGIESEEKKDEEEDELFEDAIDTIINNNQASISILQRKLRIGYTRAARLIDIMEEKKMIGPYDGRNPRKILLSKEEYISMKNNIHNENDE
ncbi:MAG: DNA translocase FtsK 4TM domain-containing protein [Arcobacteraceae bacterium]|jgi:S-DNA-T family DNA segregation ATPase FtsK/SpoIIIE|nr:DNA translocase FtsK 4TM domain-containing protein [Atribacterota bacterium]